MAKIRINGDTSGYIEISAPAVAGSTSITLPATTGGSLLATDANGNLNVDSGVLYVDGVNNRVGISTTSPSSTLHVVGNQYLTAGNYFTDGTSGYFFNGAGGFAGGIYGSSSGNIANIVSPQTILFGTASSERARIDSSGRLLVGTTTAASGAGQGTGTILQVNGSFYAYEGTNTGGHGGAIAFGTNSNNTFSPMAQIKGSLTNAPGTEQQGQLLFFTRPTGGSGQTLTERMRIKDNGFTEFANDGTIVGSNAFIFRSTLNEDTFFVRNSNVSFSNSIVRIAAARNTSNASYYFLNCVREGVLNVFYVADSGNVTNTNNSYTGISDIKLKENIVDASSQWDDIKALRVRNYNLKEGQTHKQIGLVAQEVETISPGLVYETHDRDEKGNDLGTTTKVVQYSVLYMKAVKALQEAQLRIEQLEATNAFFEARLSALEVKP